METKKYSRILLYLTVGVGAVWFGLKYLLPILLPFLIGFGLSRAAEPMVRAMGRQVKLPRWLCSTVSMGLLYMVLGVGLFFLFRAIVLELEGFVLQLPSILEGLEGPMAALQAWLSGLAQKLPDGLGNAVSQWIGNLFESGSVVAESLYRWLFRLVTGTVSSLPGIFLFLFTAILSSFFLSSEWPALRKSITRRMPASWRKPISALLHRLKAALGGWVKAQAKLMLICFVLLTAGFWLMKVDYPLLFGAGIAVIDALPVFGVGTVLIPWAVVSFLQAAVARGLGLLILYAAASLLRTALEPRFVGRQIGLSPVITLFAMYAGYRLMGIFGMILFPICAILAKQFTELWESQKN